MRKLARFVFVVALVACGRPLPDDEIAQDDGGTIVEDRDGGANADATMDARDANRPCPSAPGPALVRSPDGSFCIDATEVTSANYAAFLATSPRADAHPRCAWKTTASEVTGEAQKPAANVDWCDANAYCAWAGKRLCSEQEWIRGCSNDNVHNFPYGPSYIADACNVMSGTVEDVAFRKTCEGGYAKTFDMLGNVTEWLAADACGWVTGSGSDDTCLARGGNYDSGMNINCGMSVPSMARSMRDARDGFRCCVD